MYTVVERSCCGEVKTKMKKDIVLGVHTHVKLKRIHVLPSLASLYNHLGAYIANCLRYG